MTLADVVVPTAPAVDGKRTETRRDARADVPVASAGQVARRVLRVADLVVVTASLLGSIGAADALAIESGADLAEQLRIAALSLPLWAAFLSTQRLYSSRHIAHRLDELRRLSGAVVAGCFGLVLIAFLSGVPLSRGWIATAYATTFVALWIEREAARRAFARRRRLGKSVRTVLLIGDNAEADELGRSLLGEGYQVVGRLSPGDVSELAVADRALVAVERTGAAGVVIAASGSDLDTCNRLARLLSDRGVHVELSTPLVDIAPRRLSLRRVGRMPVLSIEPVARGGWRPVAKRMFDVALAVAGLVVVSPVFLVAAIAVKVDARGPVLFRQERTGKDGRPFELLKLRTMVVDAEQLLIDLRERNEADGPMFKMRDDPRITRVGRILRRLSIDELPQLWNVLRGEMSLVGPRPALPSEAAGWEGRLHERLRVRPGITGMWQVHGRSSASFADYVRYDLYYVDNWSLPTDLAILVRTIPAVVTRKGAY